MNDNNLRTSAIWLILATQTIVIASPTGRGEETAKTEAFSSQNPSSAAESEDEYVMVPKLEDEYVIIPETSSVPSDSVTSPQKEEKGKCAEVASAAIGFASTPQDTFSLMELENEYVIIPAIPLEALQPGVSWTELEREYVSLYGMKTGTVTRWKTFRILNSYDKEALSQICRSVFSAAYPKAPTDSHKIQSYKLIFGELIIGSTYDKNLFIDIDVVKCVTDKAHTFYVIEGSRANSVYFVKPTSIRPEKPKEFVFDERYKSDLELQFKFRKVAGSIITSMTSRPELIRFKK